MIFNDFTILAGGIHSSRVYETAELAQEAVETCAGMTTRLRRGELRVSHGIEGMIPFTVSLSAPSQLATLGEAVESAGRFFTVADPQGMEFQVNLILYANEGENEERDIATLYALSCGVVNKNVDMDALGAFIQTLQSARPCLATTLLPTLNAPLVRLAADFSTCFAAALLLEKEADA